MNISVIGAGNMGGAIVRGLADSPLTGSAITVGTPHPAKLADLVSQHPEIEFTDDNLRAVSGADIVIIAVKPWILPDVAAQISGHLPQHAAVVSVVAGATLDDLGAMLGTKRSLFRVIPDTAIAVGCGMTFIACNDAPQQLTDCVRDIFGRLGVAEVIEERLMDAATALSSCGIAYAYKYIQACVQAGVQLGFRPADAQRYAVATVEGAMAMLSRDGATPQSEIDRVTTPGGMTIRGINELDKCGFTAAVINGIMAPLSK